MPEDPIRLPEGFAPISKSTLFEHWCEHPGCKKWGGYGFARLKTDVSRWYCYEHRQDGEDTL